MPAKVLYWVYYVGCCFIGNENYNTFFALVRPNGDVILRSSDGQDFFVAKAILIIASSFFQSMFSLPQPEDQNDVTAISMSEDSTMLDTLLRICYPVRTPVVTDLELAEAVLAAALKYEMEIVIQEMCRVLVSEKSLETQAVRVYAIACRHKLVEEARAAAIASLRGPIEDIYVNEIETLPTVYYFRLLKFHRRVKDDILKVLCKAVDFGYYVVTPTKEEDKIKARCPSGRLACTNSLPEWWRSLVSNRVIPVVRDAPFDPKLFSAHDLDNALVKAEGCRGCKTAVASQWPITVTYLFKQKASAAAAELLVF